MMRTTLTLDDDVSAQIGRLRKAREQGLKEIINEALRRGLKEMSTKPNGRTPFRTRVYDGGTPLIDNIDNAEEVLSIVEGDFRT